MSKRIGINSPEFRLTAAYDRKMFHPLHAAFFGHSNYYNYGFSTEETDTQSAACANLVEKLLAFIPVKTGTILDVACGMGATTRHLLNYYEPAAVTAINISEQQLERAEQKAPGCRFINMNATRLDFPDESFDNVLCVESAFHFNTRQHFLQEALRVLKPGGRLVLSDILGRFTRTKDPNYLSDPAAYTDLFHSVGFENPYVLDASKECSRACSRRLRDWPKKAWRAGDIKFREFVPALVAGHLYCLYMLRSQRCYLICSAQKPIKQVG
jgi:MPBQ/MSBQ methyltransferase